MDENLTWAVIYTFHTHDEEFMMGQLFVNAPELTEACDLACALVNSQAEENKWSDYWVLGINVVPEYH